LKEKIFFFFLPDIEREDIKPKHNIFMTNFYLSINKRYRVIYVELTSIQIVYLSFYYLSYR